MKIMQSKIQRDINDRAKVFAWFSIIAYALTMFFPIVTYWFFFSFEAMIYDVLSEMGLVLFFGGAICSVISVVSLKNPTRFKILSLLSAGSSFIVLILIFSDVGYFMDLNVGFYTYAAAAVASLIAAITYKNPQHVQPISKPQIPEQPQVLQENIQSQPSIQLSEEKRFCTNCGNEQNLNDNFCQQCGQKFNFKG